MASWAWDNLLHGRDLLVRGGQWMVGDGTRIRVWKDKSLRSLILTQQVHQQQDLKVSELIITKNRSWDVLKVRSLFSLDIAKQILQVPISTTGVEDKFIWPYSPNGITR